MKGSLVYSIIIRLIDLTFSKPIDMLQETASNFLLLRLILLQQGTIPISVLSLLSYHLNLEENGFYTTYEV